MRFLGFRIGLSLRPSRNGSLAAAMLHLPGEGRQGAIISDFIFLFFGFSRGLQPQKAPPFAQEGLVFRTGRTIRHTSPRRLKRDWRFSYSFRRPDPQNRCAEKFHDVKEPGGVIRTLVKRTRLEFPSRSNDFFSRVISRGFFPVIGASPGERSLMPGPIIAGRFGKEPVHRRRRGFPFLACKHRRLIRVVH